jgi:hypothetical protein
MNSCSRLVGTPTGVAVGGVPTAHKQHGNATILNAPAASLDEFIQLNFYNFIRNREDDLSQFNEGEKK